MKFTKFSNQTPPRVQKDIADDIVSGAPVQHSQLMYAGHHDAIKSGIWESTAGQFTAVMQDLVEFCHILEGSATIKIGSGESFEVKAGDAFVMEAGLQTEWTVDEYVKKHFVICSTNSLPPVNG